MVSVIRGERIKRLQGWVRLMLERGLTPYHYYHNWTHTADVTAAAERIAGQEGLGAGDCDLLLAAALLHDMGYIEYYHDNEPIAVGIGRRVLPELGFAPGEIECIGRLILATRLPQCPTTLLEQALCDADLDYLGREDYCDLSERLRREWAAFGLILSDEAWLEHQVRFLTAHDYYLSSVRTMRDPGKVKNLTRLKE